ncbi:MAG TPA: alkaline phosphatase [Bryobacteraceae bacterium]|nr:alkaline phosphatase [Bryobacteraceae bacterium]
MNTTRNLGRRAFLGCTGALAGLAGSMEALAAADKPGARPKNIIWMVADGMSPSQLPLADQLSLLVRDRGILWQKLLTRRDVAHGCMDMASLDSPVTDSSSASSSWGSGSRIFNGWVNVLPDGTKLTPLAAIAHDRKKRVGLVTTTTVTHATPAGFAASERNRDDEALIAAQYLRNVDVVLGGGRRFFEAATRPDHTDLAARFREQGFACAMSRDELLKLKGTKMLGLFAASHLPYTVDRNADAQLQRDVPTLAEMTGAALASLASSPDGFLLQVEAGRVDHGAHASDAAAALWDQLAFDDAIATVLRFAEHHPETLVVLTSDHGNSNPGLVGMGREYTGSRQCFARLPLIKTSFYEAMREWGVKAEYSMSPGTAQQSAPRLTPEQLRDAVHARFGFDMAAREVEALHASLGGGKQWSLNPQLDAPVGVLGQIVGNHTGIYWTGSTHTSDYTLITALGPGSGRFNGFIRNTDVFPALVGAMGSSFRNPAMPAAKAMKFQEAAQAAPRLRPHWV